MTTVTCDCGAVNQLAIAGSNCWKCGEYLDVNSDLPEENIGHVESFGIIFFGKHLVIIK